MEVFKDVVLQKLKEGSTWASIATMVGTLSFIPHADLVGQTVGIVGVAIAATLGIWFK